MKKYTAIILPGAVITREVMHRLCQWIDTTPDEQDNRIDINDPERRIISKGAFLSRLMTGNPWDPLGKGPETVNPIKFDEQEDRWEDDSRYLIYWEMQIAGLNYKLHKSIRGMPLKSWFECFGRYIPDNARMSIEEEVRVRKAAGAQVVDKDGNSLSEKLENFEKYLATCTPDEQHNATIMVKLYMEGKHFKTPQRSVLPPLPPTLKAAAAEASNAASSSQDSKPRPPPRKWKAPPGVRNAEKPPGVILTPMCDKPDPVIKDADKEDKPDNADKEAKDKDKPVKNSDDPTPFAQRWEDPKIDRLRDREMVKYLLSTINDMNIHHKVPNAKWSTIQIMNYVDKLKARDGDSFPKIGLSFTCLDDFGGIFERYCLGELKLFEFGKTLFTRQDQWGIWKPDETIETIDKKFEEQFGVQIDVVIQDTPMDDAVADSQVDKDKDKVEKSEPTDIDEDGPDNQDTPRELLKSSPPAQSQPEDRPVSQTPPSRPAPRRNPHENIAIHPTDNELWEAIENGYPEIPPGYKIQWFLVIVGNGWTHRNLPRNQKKKPCRMWRDGTCAFLSTCQYLHPGIDSYFPGALKPTDHSYSKDDEGNLIGGAKVALGEQAMELNLGTTQNLDAKEFSRIVSSYVKSFKTKPYYYIPIDTRPLTQIDFEYCECPPPDPPKQRPEHQERSDEQKREIRLQERDSRKEDRHDDSKGYSRHDEREGWNSFSSSAWNRYRPGHRDEEEPRSHRSRQESSSGYRNDDRESRRRNRNAEIEELERKLCQQKRERSSSDRERAQQQKDWEKRNSNYNYDKRRNDDNYGYEDNRRHSRPPSNRSDYRSSQHRSGPYWGSRNEGDHA